MIRFNRLNLIRKSNSIRLLSDSTKVDTKSETSSTFLDNYKSTEAYKSKYDLSNVYPNSSLDISKKVEVPKNDERFSGYIPIETLKFSFSRSSGPGGQNVNKLNTKVTVQVDLNTADWIRNDTINKLKEIHKNSISKEGNWIIRSDKTRSQSLNVADCMDKIRCYITEAEKPPKEIPLETLERIKEGVEKANAKRLRKKRHQKSIKFMMSSDY